jgi:hypothetical protein
MDRDAESRIGGGQVHAQNISRAVDHHMRNHDARVRDSRLPGRRGIHSMASPVGAQSQPCRIQGTSLQGEDDVKELSIEEVLRIAGGVPLTAVLDELTYRAPEEQPAAIGEAAVPPSKPRKSRRRIRAPAVQTPLS